MSEIIPLNVVDDPDDAPTEDGLALPDWQAVQTKNVRSHAPAEAGQIVRQRCGGGFRVIRKQIGSN